MTILEQSQAGGGEVGGSGYTIKYQLWNRDYVNSGDMHHRQNDH